jgi:hypothetical protein
MKKKSVTMLFTDIKSSSMLWNKFGKKMMKALHVHNLIIMKITKKFNGIVIKSIGDAFMCAFTGKNSYLNAIGAAYEIQDIFARDMVEIDKNNQINIRIGLAYGDAYEYSYRLQNANLKDYLGDLVNLASRMESVMSPVNGFAFTLTKKFNEEDVAELIRFNEEDYTIKKILVKENCEPSYKRSGRILGMNMKISCELPSTLHGAQTKEVYVVTRKET